jgi:hypothetical protein
MYKYGPLFKILYINKLIINKVLYYYLDFYKKVYYFISIIKRYKLKLLLLLLIKEVIKNAFNTY